MHAFCDVNDDAIASHRSTKIALHTLYGLMFARNSGPAWCVNGEIHLSKLSARTKFDQSGGRWLVASQYFVWHIWSLHLCHAVCRNVSRFSIQKPITIDHFGMQIESNKYNCIIHSDGWRCDPPMDSNFNFNYRCEIELNKKCEKSIQLHLNC